MLSPIPPAEYPAAFPLPQRDAPQSVPLFFRANDGLQVQHTLLDLLRAALVPELRANVTAGAAGDIHLILVGVAALGAAPDELAVLLHDIDLAIPAAHLAVVALGVQIGVDDVIVDEAIVNASDEYSS